MFVKQIRAILSNLTKNKNKSFVTNDQKSTKPLLKILQGLRRRSVSLAKYIPRRPEEKGIDLAQTSFTKLLRFPQIRVLNPKTKLGEAQRRRAQIVRRIRVDSVVANRLHKHQFSERINLLGEAAETRFSWRTFQRRF